MSEIEEFAEQIEELLESVQNVIENELPNLRGTQRLEKCSYLRNRLNRAKQLHRSIIVEIRELSDELQDQWSETAKEYEDFISRLMADVSWAETSVEKDPVRTGAKSVDEMTTKEMTQQAMMVQDQSHLVATRARQVVEETIEIGANTNAELKRQGEQIKNIQDDVDQIDSNIQKANKQIRIFMRRMATDRIVLLMVFLVAAGIIVAIVLYILKRTGVWSPSAPQPTTK